MEGVGGALVVIEGPNGVGKTTLARGLAAALEVRGSVVHRTSQPSRSDLGTLLRSGEETLRGRAYALALAADRLDQQEREFVPRLRTGAVVLTDRYVHSSLVLQQIDGLPLADVWSMNSHVLRPHLTVCLDADPDVRRERIEERGTRTRLERATTPEAESLLYGEVCAFLGGMDWQHVRLDCRGMSREAVVAATVGELDCRGLLLAGPGTPDRARDE